MNNLSISTRYLAITTVFTLSTSLIWGVNVLFLLHYGLDIFQVFMLNAAFAVMSALFEVSTGVLADTRGRRFSLAVGALVLAVSTVGYVLAGRTAHPYAWFLAMSAVLGLGFSFMSGSLEAWLVDALQHTGQGERVDRVMARGVMANNVAMVVGSVGGGVLADVNLSIPYLLRALLLLILFVLVWKLVVEHGFTPQSVAWRALPAAMQRTAVDGLQFGWRQRSIKQMMLLNVLQGAFMFWAFYAWQPHLLRLWGENSIWLSGLIAALNGLAGFCGAALVGQLASRMRRRSSAMLIGLLLQVACALVLSVTTSFWLATGALLVMMAAAGFVQPMRQTYLNNLIPSSKRATVLSFDSLVNNAGASVGSPALGWVDKTHGTPYGYLVGAGLLVLGFPLLRRLRQFGDQEDLLGQQHFDRRG